MGNLHDFAAMFAIPAPWEKNNFQPGRNRWTRQFPDSYAHHRVARSKPMPAHLLKFFCVDYGFLTAGQYSCPPVDNYRQNSLIHRSLAAY
jgi:hypothetical protein